MKETLRLFLAVAAAVAVTLLLQGSKERPAPVRTTVVQPPDPKLLDRLDALERRLAVALRPVAPATDDALAKRVAELEQELAAVRAAPKPRPERRGPSNETLMARAHALSKDPGVEAIDAWSALLARDLAPAERARVYDSLATVHRKLEDYRSAAAAWQKAIDLEGRASEMGQGYSHSRAWALLYSGSRRGALDELDVLLAQPRLTDAVESSARFAAAGFAYSLGDEARARREYLEVIDRWGNSRHEQFRKRAEAADRTMRNLGLN